MPSRRRPAVSSIPQPPLLLCSHLPLLFRRRPKSPRKPRGVKGKNRIHDHDTYGEVEPEPMTPQQQEPTPDAASTQVSKDLPELDA